MSPKRQEEISCLVDIWQQEHEEGLFHYLGFKKEPKPALSDLEIKKTTKKCGLRQRGWALPKKNSWSGTNR